MTTLVCVNTPGAGAALDDGDGLGDAQRFAAAQTVLSMLPVVGQVFGPAFTVFNMLHKGDVIDPFLNYAPDDPRVVAMARNGVLVTPVTRAAAYTFDPRWTQPQKNSLTDNLRRAMGTARIAVDAWKKELADRRAQVAQLNQAGAPKLAGMGELEQPGQGYVSAPVPDFGHSNIPTDAAGVEFKALQVQLRQAIADVALYRKKVTDTQAAIDARTELADRAQIRADAVDQVRREQGVVFGPSGQQQADSPGLPLLALAALALGVL